MLKRIKQLLVKGKTKEEIIEIFSKEPGRDFADDKVRYDRPPHMSKPAEFYRTTPIFKRRRERGKKKFYRLWQPKEDETFKD